MIKLTPQEAEVILSDVPAEKTFKLHLGADIISLKELAEMLDIMSDESFQHHVGEHKNDFAKWVHDIIKDKDLYIEIVHLKTRESMRERVRARVDELESIAVRGKPFYTHELMNIGAKDFALGAFVGFIVGIIARNIFLLLLY